MHLESSGSPPTPRAHGEAGRGGRTSYLVLNQFSFATHGTHRREKSRSAADLSNCTRGPGPLGEQLEELDAEAEAEILSNLLNL
jgi:hypothetical protein